LGLGRRLRALRDAVSDPYQEIWDLCCDHGFLGMALLDKQAANKLHFVDQLPVITEPLSKVLKQYPSQCYQVHTCPAEQISINAAKKTLVIIAGVGGETVIDILEALASHNTLSNVELLLSPANSTYELRTYLREKQFGLIKEAAVFERRRGYEILHVQKNHSFPMVDAIGGLWDIARPEHRNYLQTLLEHYQKRLKNPKQKALAESVVRQYQQRLLSENNG
jgi:tRNA (adenine22-N1)-methyltransferase